ncbi:MAG: hypothetical protein ABW220_19105, partial [Burkholderiaceae bacterium]
MRTIVRCNIQNMVIIAISASHVLADIGITWTTTLYTGEAMFYPVPSSRRTLNTAIFLTAVLGTAAHAQQSPALDRVSIAVGAFNAEPKIHAAGDTDNYG